LQNTLPVRPPAVKNSRRSSSAAKVPPPNQRRKPSPFATVVRSAQSRAHETANRRGSTPGRKTVWAAVAAADSQAGTDSADRGRRLLRLAAGLVLLPLCWVTMWTLLTRLSDAAVHQDFWKTAEFWYFAIGALTMIGWFWSGLMRMPFLIAYVLGHELTHAVFVLLHLGKVSKIHVSREGGFILTNKSNLVIALSPYFVPFWSVVGALSYGIARYYAGPSPALDRTFFAAMGLTWTFHMVWTLWMIPRDQPDLRENGTFLSLVVIYMANLLVLAALLCLAADSPLANSREFLVDWIRVAATWGDAVARWGAGLIAEMRAAARV
jgi:hypothetical protein